MIFVPPRRFSRIRTSRFIFFFFIGLRIFTTSLSLLVVLMASNTSLEFPRPSFQPVGNHLDHPKDVSLIVPVLAAPQAVHLRVDPGPAACGLASQGGQDGGRGVGGGRCRAQRVAAGRAASGAERGRAEEAAGRGAREEERSGRRSRQAGPAWAGGLGARGARAELAGPWSGRWGGWAGGAGAPSGPPLSLQLGGCGCGCGCGGGTSRGGTSSGGRRPGKGQRWRRPKI